MTVTLQEARERANAYYYFVLDDEIPVEVRQFAESIYDKFAQLYNVGPVQAAELAMQMVTFFTASPNDRADMVARGEAQRARDEWTRLEKRNGRRNTITE